MSDGHDPGTSSSPGGVIAGGVIAAIEPGSVGDEVGLEPGDRLIAVNGQILRDLIDYRFYSAEEELELVVEREGERYVIEIERDYDEDLGIEFRDLVFDELRQCNNRCPFCFVRQMPRPGDLPGGRPLRRSLYIRDDDYRYSFLTGSFITLTNLREMDWERIGQQLLSPLYVSIHATDDAVRRRVLGNPQAPAILPQLQRLGEMGIDVHGQIVLWPGVNDGEVLQRSLDELLALWLTVQTLALVPVGLTRYCADGVRLMRPDEAQATLVLAEAFYSKARRRTGKTWLYPADELYLLAGQPVPPRAFYDDPAQLENGVGLVRQLLDDWARVRATVPPTALKRERQSTWVCGTLIAPFLREIADQWRAHFGGEVSVVPVVNRLLGESVTVSGLLSGHDVVAALVGQDVGERLFVPRSMFDIAGRVTLDDMTVDELSAALGVPVSPVERVSDIVAVLRETTKAG
jgi:putative radical SAM enzyme (TIGR03279 family)